MRLINEEIMKTDLSFYTEDILKNFPYLINKGEHYRLLKYLSLIEDNIIILDLGTCQGHSCLALAQNSKNIVKTYDIFPKDLKYITEKYNNVEVHIKDANKEELAILESAKIIILDIDPHNGRAEKIFLDRLKQTKFNGILICDDIHLNDGMKEFWKNVTDEKYDITSLGHWSGTGLINFTNEKIEIE